MHIQRPYFNKILHHKNGKVFAEQTLFDQRWQGGERCDVAGKTWEYIKQTMINHGDNIKRLQEIGTDDAIKICKSEQKKVPTIIAYNGSGFDFQFILKRFLNDKTCSRRFEINNIFKGSRLIFLQVRDKYSGARVLKTHDMSELLLCPLKKALTDFCREKKGDVYVDTISKQVVEKIEFKEEILYIMNNYHKNPDILKPGHVSAITKRLFTKDGIIEKETNKLICLHDEVIKYAENDVDVLPKLYEAMDKYCKDGLSTNVTSFITAGSLAWYGLISNLPNECLENAKYDHNRNKSSFINSKLFRLEQKELKFVQQSIKGGRVCPRIHTINNDDKYVYLDISGMYASIMRNEIFPYGKAKFLDIDEVSELNKLAKQLKQQHIENKLQWKVIYNKLKDKFGLFIAECDFEENTMNLEPIVQYKKNNRTYYTVERRIDTITSLDIALIIASGGTIHNMTRVLTWQHHGQIMNKWIQKTLHHKNEGQRTGNLGLKAFGKLEANASYGQCLKGDKNEVIRFINCFEDADEFVSSNSLTKFFDMDEYDVYVGKKQIDNETFVTSRCQHLGTFVLAYTRAMIYDICEVAMPNRYNKEGIKEQPVYGDTDSLVFREWQAHLLIKAGWVKFENGKLTDELGEKSYWFLLDRLKDLQVTDYNNQTHTTTSPFNELLNEQIWKDAIEDEKRNPANYKFYYVTEGIFAAPKSYACKYTNNSGSYNNEKMKFKGVPTTALIGEQTLNYNLISQAYTNKNEHYTAVLQSKPQVIKNFSKSESKRAFLEVVDSNLRRDHFVKRELFKSKWIGRLHIDNNFTVPYGYNGLNTISQ